MADTAVLKSDAEGFLVGEEADISGLVKLWDEIFRDTRAIRGDISRILEAVKSKAGKPDSAAVVNTPRRRGGTTPKKAEKTEKPQAATGTERPRTDGKPRRIRLNTNVSTLDAAETAVAAQSDAAEFAENSVAAQVSSVMSLEEITKALSEKPVEINVPGDITIVPDEEAAVPAKRASRIPAAKRKKAETAPLPETANVPGDITIVPDEQESDGPSSVSRAAPDRKRRIAAPKRARERDNAGRFVGKRQEDRELAGESKIADGLLAVASATDKVAAAAENAINDTAEIDPAIAAMQEVVSPLSRAFDFLPSLDRVAELSVLKKIWRGLASKFKKDEKDKKAEARDRKEIKKAIEKQGGKGGSSGIGAKLGALFGGVFGRIFGGIGKFGKLFGVVGKKIPLLAAIVSGVSGLFKFLGIGDDANLTQREKDQKRGRVVGGTAGTIAGMLGGAKLGAAIGTAIAPGIGTAVGSIVGGAAGMFFSDKAGQTIGGYVGDWINDLRNADIAGMIEGAWNTTCDKLNAAWASTQNYISTIWDVTTDLFSSVWDDAVTLFKSAWEGAKSAVTSAWQSACDKFPEATRQIEAAWKTLCGNVEGAWNTAADEAEKAAKRVGEAFDALKALLAGALSSLREKAKSIGGTVWESLKGFSAGVKNFVAESTVSRAVRGVYNNAEGGSWTLGETSAEFESGGRGAGTISSGKGDNGGKSYGLYQLSSKQGSVGRFLKQSGYAGQFEGLAVGSDAFDAKWRELAADDPAFEQAQRDYAKAEYYDKTVSELRKSGIDLSGRGRAVQDALFSTSIQFGASGGSSVVRNALAGQDTATLADEQIVRAIQAYKRKNNDRLFASSSGAVREGVLKRIDREEERLVTLAREDAVASTVLPPVEKAPSSIVTTNNAVAASAPVPAAPAVTPQPAAPVTVKASLPLGSRESKKPLAVSIQGEIYQDVHDRGIALAANGGLSGGD